MKIGAIYARSSLGKDKQGDTVEHQVAMIKEFAKRTNIDVVFDDRFIYMDDGSSGFKTTLLQREPMKAMLDDIDKGLIDTVFFKGISRFARDSGESITTAKKLNYKGVRVISLEENYDSFRDEPTMFQIHAVLAEQESRKTSIRVSLGNKQKARNGDWPGTTPPIGLTKVKHLKDEELKKHLLASGRRPHSLHPDEYAPMVRKIFEMYLLDNLGRKRIVSKINDLGYRTRDGKFFKEKHVVDILSNEAYIGNIVYGKTRYDYVEDEGKNKKIQRTVKIDEVDWVRTENAHPAIIEKEVFEAVQKKIQENKKTFAHPKKFNAAKHPLTGLLKCGKCGGNMICQKRTNKKKDGTRIEYRYYVCSTYHQQGRNACPQANINADHLEEDISNFIEKKLSVFEDIDVSKRVQEKDDQKQRIMQEIRQVDLTLNKKLSASKSLLESKDLYDIETFIELNKTLQDEIKDLRQKKDSLDKEKDSLGANDSRMDLKELYEEFKQKKQDDIPYRRKVFHKLLESVVFEDNQVSEINFKQRLEL
ncbi:recombinase family protein [Halalkalibacterium halodurans]|uniref:recombinase family protein n=1 Tax=Halalkalibacterium halodurans TaxID=86665 RepID=UPI002E1D6D3D|nr:recombinase family protein [Halalkalibacterium halodurans]MED4163552.1 recombinase family protein [Halalkalibacterium halodurans]